jgi:hypothetical protein
VVSGRDPQYQALNSRLGGTIFRTNVERRLDLLHGNRSNQLATTMGNPRIVSGRYLSHLWPSAAEKIFLQFRDKRIRIDRLFDVAGTTSLDALFTIANHGIRGDCNDGYICKC